MEKFTFAQQFLRQFGDPPYGEIPDQLARLGEASRKVSPDLYPRIITEIGKRSKRGYPNLALVYEVIGDIQAEHESAEDSLRFAENLKKQRWQKEQVEKEAARNFAASYLTKTDHGKTILMEGWFKEAASLLQQKYLNALKYKQQALDWRSFRLELPKEDLDYYRNFLSFADHAESWKRVHLGALLQDQDEADELLLKISKWRLDAQERAARGAA